jgi:hypothetical protein
MKTSRFAKTADRHQKRAYGDPNAKKKQFAAPRAYGDPNSKKKQFAAPHKGAKKETAQRTDVADLTANQPPEDNYPYSDEANSAPQNNGSSSSHDINRDEGGGTEDEPVDVSSRRSSKSSSPSAVKKVTTPNPETDQFADIVEANNLYALETDKFVKLELHKNDPVPPSIAKLLGADLSAELRSLHQEHRTALEKQIEAIREEHSAELKRQLVDIKGRQQVRQQEMETEDLGLT